MSNIKELIRDEVKRLFEKYQESERRANEDCDNFNYEDITFYQGKRKVCSEILSFIDTLPDESAQPTRGYDEAYLNEKIAKASKSWKGVDVDKFMDEIRGREPVTDCYDLTEAAEAYSRQVSRGHNYRDLTCGFIAGAKWQKEQETREMIMSDGSYFQKCYELGKKAMKEQMIEGAVEGVVWWQVGKNISIRVLKGACKYLEQDDLPYKVRMIILPEEDE